MRSRTSEAAADDPAYACVEQFFQCLPGRGLPLPSNETKARVQVFLASRREAGNSLGVAAQRDFLDWKSAAFEGVKQFVRQIASQQASQAAGS